MIGGAYDILVSTPDLLPLVPDGFWLPVARDFATLKRKYAMDARDQRALKLWKGAVKRTVVSHAPTNTELKGSATFYKIITELVDNFPDLEFQSIRDVPWDTCMRMLSSVSILYDQYILGGYGMISVEASIFEAAVFCKLDPEVARHMERESGLPQPFIQWIDDDELRTQSFMLVQDQKLQRKFGGMARVYCQKMHDDPNVAFRFLKHLGKV